MWEEEKKERNGKKWKHKRLEAIWEVFEGREGEDVYSCNLRNKIGKGTGETALIWRTSEVMSLGYY